jgi:hypothetical protein
LTWETLQAFCDGNLGTDCSGFAFNYYGVTKPLPESAEKILCNAVPRKRVGDIRNGDSIVYFNSHKTAKPEDAVHVAIVAGSPSAAGTELLFDLVQSAGGNGNIGLELVTGGRAQLASEKDGQLYYVVTKGSTAGRHGYFSAGPINRGTPRY